MGLSLHFLLHLRGHWFTSLNLSLSLIVLFRLVKKQLHQLRVFLEHIKNRTQLSTGSIFFFVLYLIYNYYKKKLVYNKYYVLLTFFSLLINLVKSLHYTLGSLLLRDWNAVVLTCILSLEIIIQKCSICFSWSSRIALILVM